MQREKLRPDTIVELGEELESYRNNVMNQVKDAVQHFRIKSEPEFIARENTAQKEKNIPSSVVRAITASNHTERTGTYNKSGTRKDTTTTGKLNLVLPEPGS